MRQGPDTQYRARGALIGLAIGDAVGTTLEFKPPGSFTPITDMVGGGPFNLKPGQWTDDAADTMAANAGQLADALYGIDAIPEAWRQRLHRHGDILALADALHALARSTYRGG